MMLYTTVALLPEQHTKRSLEATIAGSLHRLWGRHSDSRHNPNTHSSSGLVSLSPPKAILLQPTRVVAFTPRHMPVSCRRKLHMIMWSPGCDLWATRWHATKVARERIRSAMQTPHKSSTISVWNPSFLFMPRGSKSSPLP